MGFSRILGSGGRGLRTAAFQTRTLLTQSYAQGPTEPPLLTHTIPQHFSSTVSQHGDRPALIAHHQGPAGRLTYSALDSLSGILAKGLQERGVRKGERVAVMLGNCWEFGVVGYALFKLGAVLVPLNPAFNAPQVISALNHLGASQLIVSAETNLPYKAPRSNVPLLRALIADLGAKKLESGAVGSLRDVVVVDNAAGRVDVSSLRCTTPFSSLLEERASGPVIPDAELHRDDVINIQFTSGTTSSPKAACLTHESILNNGYFIGQRMGLGPQDVVCCPPPLFHCFGCVLGYMATATNGAAILFPSEAFDPLKTLLAVQDQKATALYGVATMFIAELDLLSSGTVPREGFQHLRTGIAAGSSVPSELMAKLHRELNLTGLTICYGMTETSPVSCMTTPTDPLPKRLDSVGRLLPHVSAKIVSPSSPSRILPIGQKGELVVSGYLVMRGYFNDPDRTKEVRSVDERGRVWMRTGDEAVMDAEGYVRITGRLKDLIIRGGENVYPLEVENCLFGCEGVGEVSVVGVPDERYGEVVGAFVVPGRGFSVGPDDTFVPSSSKENGGEAETETADLETASEESGEKGKTLTREDIKNWVRQNLSSHLVPKYVFWVKEYPKTASGKIQKFVLKEMGVRWLKEGRGEGRGEQGA